MLLLIVFYRQEEFILTLLSAFIHEIGHIIAIVLLGEGLNSLKLSPGGIVIEISGRVISFWKRLTILLSGPLLNIIFFIVSDYFSWRDSFKYSNLMLALLNLLPVASLDGGEAVDCILERYFLPGTAYSLRSVISALPIFLLFAFSAYIMLFMDGNPSLYLVCVSLFIINYTQKD